MKDRQAASVLRRLPGVPWGILLKTVLLLVILGGVLVSRLYSYLLFHALAEIFGIETTVDPVAIHKRLGYLPGELVNVTGGPFGDFSVLAGPDGSVVRLR